MRRGLFPSLSAPKKTGLATYCDRDRLRGLLTFHWLVVNPEVLAKLLADLDADDFEAREHATKELEKLDDAVEGRLRRVAEQSRSPEARRRARELLEGIGRRAGAELPPERLRQRRALEVLEQLGTPEALSLLEALAAGEPQASLTRLSAAALRRLPP